MAIPVTCPSCKFEGDAPDETAGQTVLCPDCRCNIPVPGGKPSRVSERPPSNRPAPEWPSRRPAIDDIDDDDDRKSDSNAPPNYSQQVSAAGWLVFVLLLVLVCPFICWIGLFIKEDVRKCSDCGARL